MIGDLFLRWIVTALFVVSALECGYAIVTGHRAWTHVVGHLLHFVMAVAMAVMAWPRGAALPTTGPMVFFAAATVWFVAITVATARHRAVAGYHAFMMLAMAWMYAVMNGRLLPGQPMSGHHDAPASAMAMDMPGMDMSAAAGASSGPGYPGWIDAVDWLCTVVFAAAAVWWLYRYFAARQADPAHPQFGTACQAMMAAGMAVMFGVML
ncbi:DUF5134 domain-containing protein [Mycobacterium dioxanotrophicus]|uniref:DUF5134 domain-containing protein n=1 Tax=Mycobacterium dioxanotrophicus TaxID=482462 RepID=A0A1Y0C8H0_9MYCO|nr:DUF5134 domain-containing protein [Mycobacterium dioxanotrophicus]ART71531.1 DUF5134 domain-containing protein [Mycobacterium dioxanotrophicus]